MDWQPFFVYYFINKLCLGMLIKMVIISKYGIVEVNIPNSATNDKNQLYKQLVRVVPASNKNFFSKEVKSYIYSLEGQTAKIIFPAADNKQLALHQKFLVVHLFIPYAAQWSMQLGITDINGIKRRVNLTTAQGKIQVKYFSVRYPLDNLQKGTWLFLAINVHSFIDAFKNQVFRSLDHITIGSNCLLRRMFTMKQWLQWQIPKTFWLSTQINQQFQLIQYRQLSLPKINLLKSVIYDQNSPNIVETKSTTIKNSNSNLSKSQINTLQKLKGSGIVQSQSPSKKSQPVPRRKASMISNSNVIRQNKIKQLKRKQNNIIKSGQIGKLSENRVSSQIQEKQLKSSPKKSPLIEKSFQQEQAFINKKQIQSEIDFETSNESFSQRPIKGLKKYEKWQQQPQIPMSMSKNMQNQPNQAKYKPVNKQNRTTLTKQNSIKKISNYQNRGELQLIYDEMVGFYYHPETQTYYELKQ